MNGSPLTARRWSLVPPSREDAAIDRVGWHRVGLLQRLVKTEPDAVTGASDGFHPERPQRRAA
jgi:hypothetical protein